MEKTECPFSPPPTSWEKHRLCEEIHKLVFGGSARLLRSASVTFEKRVEERWADAHWFATDNNPVWRQKQATSQRNANTSSRAHRSCPLLSSTSLVSSYKVMAVKSRACPYSSCTYCRESSFCGRTCHRTAPPRRGKQSLGTLHTCCRLPSLALLVLFFFSKEGHITLGHYCK